MQRWLGSFRIQVMVDIEVCEAALRCSVWQRGWEFVASLEEEPRPSRTRERGNYKGE